MSSRSAKSLKQFSRAPAKQSSQGQMIALSSSQIPAGLVRDKQLQVVDVPTALFKWNNGMAVNLKELAVVTGYDYASVRRWGVPLFTGKITKSEFESWKRS